MQDAAAAQLEAQGRADTQARWWSWDLEETMAINDDQIAAYVHEHTPELRSEGSDRVHARARQADEPGTPIEWAVRLLRQRGETSV